MAQIPRACGCGAGQQLELHLDPLTEFPYAAGVALKRKKKKSTHILQALTLETQNDVFFPRGDGEPSDFPGRGFPSGVALTPPTPPIRT